MANAILIKIIMIKINSFIYKLTMSKIEMYFAKFLIRDNFLALFEEVLPTCPVIQLICASLVVDCAPETGRLSC